ncbi:HAD family hydrolase [Priestia taiwanensis]|uniref:Haloacid dehalogenase n=1 Tax=Priestia taiwanensis TaxID=1347902 RepID=A0A917EP24_9BACI|nr:HAD-IA family hydrolase [Priestia taiwanensis]MBM7363844.1 putative hydrolase of the HAD superfamily [Priestia taiwanensis]GGE69456.1 haloacid dehalogenase [Priestia taiwanensis]
MKEAVLFDLDETLLNRRASVRSFIENQYERLYTYVGHVEKDVYIDSFLTLEQNGYVWKDVVYEKMVRAFGIEGIAPAELLDDYVTGFSLHCVPFPSLHEILRELKERGFLLGIITNGYGEFQMRNIKALGIKEYFDVILVSEWEGMKKPEAEIFHRALQKLEVEPHASIFVGDHPLYDVQAARNIGMKGIWKRNDYFTLEAEADATIDDLVEILAFVQIEVRK